MILLVVIKAHQKRLPNQAAVKQGKELQQYLYQHWRRGRLFLETIKAYYVPSSIGEPTDCFIRQGMDNR